MMLKFEMEAPLVL